MKIKKKKIILIFSMLISLLLASISWKYINLRFIDPGINGIYSDNQFNSFNEIIRYVVFIFLPISTYLLNKFLFEENFFLKIKFFFTTKENSIFEKIDNLNIYFSILILIIILEFLSVNFPNHLIDIYHEGQILSSAYKSLLDGSLWSGSYVTVGIFYETLSSKFIWQLFDHISIGLVRFAEVFYILILKVFLIILSYFVTKQTSLKPILANLFFIIISLFSVNLLDYNTASVDLLTYKEIPVIFLIILFLNTNFTNNNILVLILISLMSIFSMLWGLDRGLVCNFLIILMLLNFSFQKDFKKVFFIISFISMFWLFFYLFNKIEFFYFVENSFSILKDYGYIYGVIHPIPLSDEVNSSRATKTLFLIVFSLIFSLSLIFKNKKYSHLKLKKFFLFFAIIGTTSYLYALGRSDGPHIKQVFGFQIMFFLIYILNNMLNKYSNKINSLFSVNIILVILTVSLFFNNIKLSNILSFKERFVNYIYKPDLHFLSQQDNLIIDELKSYSSLDNCMDLFTYDASILYLLRKKSCTKYYFVNSLGSQNNQKKFIKEIKLKTKYIITNGKTDYWDSIYKKYPLVNDFISKNFYLYKDVSYKIMKMKSN